jgi:hypothetical protein
MQTPVSLLLRSPARPRVPIAVIAIVVAMASSGCDAEPPIKLRYKLTDGVTQKCPAACASVSVSCDAVLSIRVVDPSHPETSFVSVCERIEAARSLCEMSRIRLPDDIRLPQRRLAIQVALYNADYVTEVDGLPVCPADLPFDANNFAAPSPYQPAIAGIGYYNPGDLETQVELGCADVTVINTPACRGDDRIRVTASVDDFDSGVFLPSAVADKVELGVGEPLARLNPLTQQTEYVMPVAATRSLQRVEDSLPGAWRTEVTRRFNDAACVEVYEDAAQSTKTLSCKRVSPLDSIIDLRGVRLARLSLLTILDAIGEREFPESGLVVGLVVDGLGVPTSNVAVRPSSGTVQYLSSGRDKLSGTVTSNSGIFVSRDAPFATTWTAPGASDAYGGLVVGRVTVIILQPGASL